MTTEDDARLRQLMRMSHELPEPSWNLFARTTKKWSKMRQAPITIAKQAEAETTRQREALKQRTEALFEAHVGQRKQEFEEKVKQFQDEQAKSDFEARQAILAATKDDYERARLLFEQRQAIKKRNAELEKERKEFAKDEKLLRKERDAIFKKRNKK